MEIIIGAKNVQSLIITCLLSQKFIFKILSVCLFVCLVYSANNDMKRDTERKRERERHSIDDTDKISYRFSRELIYYTP